MLHRVFLLKPTLSCSLCHTQPVGCLTAVLPPCLSMPVWRQAAGVLWLEDQRASERWSPCEPGCVGGGEKVYTFLFSLPSHCYRRELLSLPQTNITASTIQLHVSYRYYVLLKDEWRAFFRELLTANIANEGEKGEGGLDAGRACEKICSHTKIQDDFDLIKFITFEVTQFHSTPLSDLNLVSGMLTQDTALLTHFFVSFFSFFNYRFLNYNRLVSM